MGNIITFEDFSRKSKSVLEDTILPTGNSTVFLEPQGKNHGHHHDDDHGHDHEKNYMFFKNLYAMQKCIEEMMSMDKEKVDELLENGHDWASDHITSAKDDVQEVFDWLRYEIENYEGEEHDHEDDEDHDGITVDVEGDDDEVEIEDGDDDDEEEEDEEGEEEEEETSEGKGPKYSYKEEKK